jgi:hypothetical protein
MTFISNSPSLCHTDAVYIDKLAPCSGVKHGKKMFKMIAFYLYNLSKLYKAILAKRRQNADPTRIDIRVF